MKANSKLFKFQTLDEQVQAISFMAANNYSPTWESGVYKNSKTGNYWVRFYVDDEFNWDLVYDTSASTPNAEPEDKISLVPVAKWVAIFILMAMLTITIAKSFVTPEYASNNDNRIALQETPMEGN